MTLMVGVSGVRGLIGRTLTPQIVLDFANAYAQTLGGGRVVLARDSRPSGEMLEAAATAGLVAGGCTLTRLGVAMTPTVGHAIVTGSFRGGMSITASHNPGEWNGLKFLDHRGLAPDAAFANRIAETRAAGDLTCRSSDFPPLETDLDAGERHANAVLAAVEVDLAPLRGTRVVLDSVNGAGGLHSAAFLDRLGCDVVHLNGEPTGAFAHPPEPLAENLVDLCAAVKEHSAAVGFAQDPDADRVAVVDEQGTCIGEEYSLALAAWSVLSRRPGPVAANLSTSRLVDAVAQRFGGSVVRTAVGEANVARGILDNDAVVGGEGNGGVIDPRITLVRDSLAAMSLVLQLMASTGKPLSKLVGDLPRYAMIKQKFECPRARIATATDAVAERFSGERVDRSDGTRVDFAEGWVHVRASNTEPIVRFIAEAEQRETAESLLNRVREAAGL